MQLNVHKQSIDKTIHGLIELARQAMQEHDWLEAWRCWDAVRESSPEHAAMAYLGAGQALGDAARFSDAEIVLGDGAKCFPDDEKIATAHAWVANARRDWPAALPRWESVCARFPQNPWTYIGRMLALRGAGRSEEAQALIEPAESALAAATERGLDETIAVRMEFEIARIRADWTAVRVCAEKILASEATPAPQILLALAQARWHLGDPEGADEAAQRALSADPALTEALLIRVWVATAKGDGETTLACYRRLVAHNPDAVRWALKLVQLLNWQGSVREAAIELEKIRRRWPDDPLVQTFLRNYGPASDGDCAWATASSVPAEDSKEPRPLLVADPDRGKDEELQVIFAQAPGASEQVRPIVAPDPDRDVLIGKVPGADIVVFVFTGTNDELTIPLPLFDRYLATLRVTAIYLKDFNRLRFLMGIQSLSDNYAGTLQALRSVMKRVGATRLCTIGNCVGGFAAIRYGVDLGAERILTFGAPTCSPTDPLASLEEGRRFLRTRLETKVPPEMTDLKPFLETSGNTAPIEMFYEEQDPRDRMQALRLSGLPGVRLHPQRALSYRLLRRMASSNPSFGGMLAELLGVAPVSAVQP
jgi:tetratricopeptide (TPR) repeat protein